MKMIRLLYIALLSLSLSACSSTKYASSDTSSGNDMVVPINLTNPKAIKIYENPETKRTYKFVENPNISGEILVIEEFETKINNGATCGPKIITATTSNVLIPNNSILDIRYHEVCFLRVRENNVYYSIVVNPNSHDAKLLRWNL